MTCLYTLFLSRLSLPVLKKHTRQFLRVLPRLDHSPPAGKIFSRYFCEKYDDLYASINEEDFETHEKSSPYKDVDFDSIAQGDPEVLKALKQVQLEVDILVQEAGQVPSKISTANWIELISLPSRYRRLKHLKFLWTNEIRKQAKKEKQEFIRKEFEAFKAAAGPRPERSKLTTASPVQYGLLATTLFHRFYEQKMKQLYNFRLLQASMFGPHLIIDCGYEEFMTQIDFSQCSKDMLYSWANNREHFYPFDLIFCNLRRDSNLFSRLALGLPAIHQDPACPFNYTDKHYLDLFPKDKLIYLTPHSNNVMESYEGDCVYIIGGLSDTSKDMAVSLAKAKREGIRRAKFPLDKYIRWTHGKKTLSISECVKIMNDVKDGRTWEFAFRNLRVRQSQGRNALLEDGEEQDTNSKTAKHIEELLRRKNTYDILLAHTAKKK